jgi:hypothetical protein
MLEQSLKAGVASLEYHFEKLPVASQHKFVSYSPVRPKIVILQIVHHIVSFSPLPVLFVPLATSLVVLVVSK